ncbi:Os01g0636900 [Oryza sativa Japonica Group]|uniref:Os01g0636900 protein n=3 Tax=Oryza sativa TaxID=4530 RepID=B9EY92_ORYSJ|nr:hypothetical protein OsI_02994 [Oryza sativa Indica Group]EEE55055.1 hypothetical protein OsJ_02755 [Oryza sativa Japonica Group]BAS73341.1 Os01g0636900 [Oryza sativa Japonica Group]
MSLVLALPFAAPPEMSPRTPLPLRVEMAQPLLHSTLVRQGSFSAAALLGSECAGAASSSTATPTTERLRTVRDQA